MNEIQKLLRRIYFSEDPGGFSSSLTLYKAAKKVNNAVTLRQVREYLKSNKSFLFTSKQPPRSVIPKSTVLQHADVYSVNETWFCDTAFLRPSFGNYKYLICQIDYLSKYARVHCLRRLSAENALIAFKTFLEEAGNPNLISLVTDDGSEWKSDFAKFIQEKGIKNIKIKERNKSWLCERLIRTLRSYAARIRKGTTLKDECKIFKLACHQYNQNYSTAIGRSPADAILPSSHAAVRDFILRKRYQELDKIIPVLDKVQKFHLDDIVLRRLKREPFQKESGRDTLSSIEYKISKIVSEYPFQVFKLRNLESNLLLPGSYTFRDIVKKPKNLELSEDDNTTQRI